MRWNLLLLCAITLGLLIFGLIGLHATVIALAIPPIVYLAAAIFTAPQGEVPAVTRELSSERVREGTPVAVKLSVGPSVEAFEEIRIEDRIPPGAEADGESGASAFLSVGSRLELCYSVRAPRGACSFYGADVWIGDTFGLLWRIERGIAPGLFESIPCYRRLGPVKIRPFQTRGFFGPIPSRQPGTGVDFLTIRGYQAGDPERRINWRMAARRQDELYTNVCEQERVVDVGIILDARSRLDVAVPGGSLFECALRAAGALADSLLRDGNRVSLTVYGGSIEHRFPGYGRVQRERILQLLAKTRTGHNFALGSLGNLPTRLLPSRSQVLLVSPLLHEDLPALTRLRAHGYSVTAVCPDPVSAGALRQTEPGSREELAHRIARAERVLLLQRVKRVGVQVVEWNVDEPLEQAVHRVLAVGPALRRIPGVGP